MTSEEVRQAGGVRVGGECLVTWDAGFKGGTTDEKVVAGITVVEWTADEQRRLNVPARETFWRFTDGSTAGHYDRVRAP